MTPPERYDVKVRIGPSDGDLKGQTLEINLSDILRSDILAPGYPKLIAAAVREFENVMGLLEGEEGQIT